MNERDTAKLLQQLAEEPATDRRDPWPAIRARLTQRHPPRSAGVRTVPRLAWGAMAAAVVVVAIGGSAVLDAARPRSVTAAEILDRMQIEVQGGVMTSSESTGGCEPIVNPTELTDRVGQILGVSGERVRQAMQLRTIRVAPPGGGSGAPPPAAGSEPVRIPFEAGAPAPGAAGAQGNVMFFGGEANQVTGPLPDPMGRLAQQLGVSVEQVRQAFADPTCPDRFMIRFPGSATDPQYVQAAQKLGITAQQLVDAVRATAPLPPPGVDRAALSPDQMMQRIASELGVTPEQFRAALEQAGGSPGTRGPDFLLPR